MKCAHTDDFLTNTGLLILISMLLIQASLMSSICTLEKNEFFGVRNFHNSQLKNQLHNNVRPAGDGGMVLCVNDVWFPGSPEPPGLASQKNAFPHTRAAGCA